jgi:hypothetical protein
MIRKGMLDCDAAHRGARNGNLRPSVGPSTDSSTVLARGDNLNAYNKGVDFCPTRCFYDLIFFARIMIYPNVSP